MSMVRNLLYYSCQGFVVTIVCDSTLKVIAFFLKHSVLKLISGAITNHIQTKTRQANTR